MNNNQFRRLVLETPGRPNDNDFTEGARSRQSAKRSSFIPMTPRTVKGSDVDFARQVRERNAALQPPKKYKASAPKGVKYGSTYIDRAKARAEAENKDDADDKASRITALEEQMKLGQISVETFEALRDKITGGDIANTHLVKGLDRKLLERVKRGEDVLGIGEGSGDTGLPQDVDEELDKLGEQDVEAISREKIEKKGTKAAPPQLAGVKRSRNEIMAELKAQRKATAEAKAAPALDSRWKKVGEKEKSRIEIDRKGREVLITVDEDGVVKKKVRKVSVIDNELEEAALEMPDADKPVLGAEVTIPDVQKDEALGDEDVDEDDDIFGGVGAEYNPLGDEDEGESSDEDEDEDGTKERTTESANPPKPAAEITISPDSKPPLEGEVAVAPRSYFKDTTSNADEASEDRLAGVQELLKKAARMDPSASNEATDDGIEDREARLKKRAEMLSQQDRDLDDMDMGFGSSRHDDGEEDGEGKKPRLHEWKGLAGGEDDGWQEGERGDIRKKKRKPKKRKGDVNNAGDIMRVIEERKAAAGK